MSNCPLRSRAATTLTIMALVASASTHSMDAAPPTVAATPSTARTPAGELIRWREHIIDERTDDGDPLTGGDGLVTADLDGDGVRDIVSVHESDTQYDGIGDGYIRAAFGTGDPDHWVNVTLASGAAAAAPEDAAVADVNGDGHPDVVAASELAHLLYLENPGRNARTAPWRSHIPTLTLNRGSFIRVFLADFDGDGRPEVATANKGAQNPERGTTARTAISVFKIEGDPLADASWKEHELGRYIVPQNAEPVDIDGDGDLDIMGGSRGEGRLILFENVSRGGVMSFREHTVDIAGARAGGFNLAYADFDRDGRLDVVAATPAGIAWIAQPASFDQPWRAFHIGTFAPDSMTGFAVADIDGDGHPDVMAGSYSGGPRDVDGDVGADQPLGRIGWFRNPGDATGIWQRHDISRRKRGMFDKFLADDVDRDGDVDFLGTRGNSNPYDGVFWLEQVRSEGPAPAFTRARAADSAEMPLPGAD